MAHFVVGLLQYLFSASLPLFAARCLLFVVLIVIVLSAVAVFFFATFA